MPDEQTDKGENSTDIDDLYPETANDSEIIAATYIRKFFDRHIIKNMETSGNTIGAANSQNGRRCSDSSGEDSDLVVVSVVMNKKQKENDEVAMAIERLRKNGVNCVFFTMNDIRNGNFKSDTKVIEALQNSQSFMSQSENNSFGSPGLAPLTPIVTSSETAASAQVSEITSTLPTTTISNSNSAIVPQRCDSGQKSPDITAISSSSSGSWVSRSYGSVRPASEIVQQTEYSVSSTPKLTREWEEAPPPKKNDTQRSRSSTPPPPVLSPQVETENSATTVDAISEPTISSCDKVDENVEQPKKKRRKRRRQSFFYRPAPKKKKVCPFAQAVVKAELNMKKELEECAATLQASVQSIKENVEISKSPSDIVEEVSIQDSEKVDLRKGKRVRVQVQVKQEVALNNNNNTQITVDKIMPKPVNGILKKAGKKRRKRKVVIRNLNVEKVNVKAEDDFLQKVEVIVDISQQPNNAHLKADPVALVTKSELIEKLDVKSETVKVKVVRKSKSRWKGKRAKRKKKAKMVHPIKIKLNGGLLRAFSPDITIMNNNPFSLPPVVNCVQSISDKLDVQDDDKSIEDVQLQVDEIVKALESESGLEDELDNSYTGPPAQISCAIIEEAKDFSTKELEAPKVTEKGQSLVAVKEQPAAAPTIKVKEELEDQIADKTLIASALIDSKSDSIPDSPDAMQLRRSSFYSLISGNVRINLEKYMDGRTNSSKTPKRRKRVKNGFLLHHGDNYPDDPESPYKLHLATQVLLKLNKRRVKFKPKEDRGRSLLSYLKLAPKRSPRIGKGPSKTLDDLQVAAAEPLPLFSGEWSLPRKFICNICGHGEDCFWDLVHHKGENHPGVLATHVELTHPAPPGLIRRPPENSDLNYPPPPCTKCSQKFSTFPDLHRHIFECAGNAAWLEEKTTRKKKAKRRRGFKRRLSNTPKKANNGKKAEATPKRRHSEVFKCEFCTREFKTEGWLKNHLLTHSLPVSIPLEKLSPPSRASLTSYRHVNVK